MANTIERKKTKGYSIDEVIEVIEMLSKSQGFYGRLLEQILYLQEYEPDQFEYFKMVMEKQNFKDMVDVVLFFET